jgi:hypothetical protein
MNQIIQDKVTEFVNDTKVFTSLDIANAIKTDGTWIRNREVASCLRNWTPPVGYGMTKISVTVTGGGPTQASVYVPNTLSLSDYVATAQDAMTPTEFETLHGKKPFNADPVVSNVVHQVSAVDDADTADGTSLTQKLKAAFKFAPPS